MALTPNRFKKSISEIKIRVVFNKIKTIQNCSVAKDEGSVQRH